MHAGWNLLARHQKAEVLFFERMLLILAMAGFIPVGLSEYFALSLSPTAWLCAAGSGACFGVYFYCLARAYSQSDFTAIYPITRALPVLFITFGDVARGRLPSPLGGVGILLVAAGCFLAPLKSIREFHPRRYVNRHAVWIVVTALATVGFTMLDKIASEALRQTGAATAARYGYMLYLIACLTYFGIATWFGESEKERGALSWVTPVLGGCLTFGGYWLVLWAYQMTRHATYVFSFRQFSIVIGVLLAFRIYREKGIFVRLTGTALITAGIVLIAVWGK
jgi:drug/metabolite transporter (DMT)-like permease